MLMGVDLRQLESISSEFLNVVQDLADSFDGHSLDLVQPVANNLENFFVLICRRDFLDDVFHVGRVKFEHRGCFRIGLQLLEQLAVDLLVKFVLETVRRGCLPDDASEGQFQDDQKVLVDVKHQVLQVCVDRCLSVDRRLFIGQQVVELDDAYRNHSVLLRPCDHRSQEGVLHDLLSDRGDKVIALSHVPPVIAHD